jgi:hypothetical protein
MLKDEQAIVSFESCEGLRDLCIGENNNREIQERHTDLQVFHIRMANSDGRREAASLLIKKMYGWRGYAISTNKEQLTDRITLYAETGGQTVGTMSLCLDRNGSLPADEVFGDKLDALRAQGRRLCEPSRLAIEKNVTKRVFASLIHISYIYSHNIHGFSDYIIEVNPRHVMFYKRMLGFHDFGEERVCPRVGAPAVLLRLPLDHMGEQIARFGGLMEMHGTERSFYPYFFSIKDEPGITQRLIDGRG